MIAVSLEMTKACDCSQICDLPSVLPATKQGRPRGRSGNQIDRVADRTTLPTLEPFVPGATGIRPAPLRVQSDFWAQGITFGLGLSF